MGEEEGRTRDDRAGDVSERATGEEAVVDRSVRSEALSVGASAQRANAGGATRRVAHHDSRTPSTASSAPQSGVCIARVWSSPPSLLDPSRRRGDAPRRRAGASWMPPRDPRPTFVARLARANRTRDALLATPPSTRSRVLALAKDARAAVRCDPRTANATSRGAHCARRRGLGLDGDDGCLMMMSARTSEGDLLDDETRRARRNRS